MKKIRVAVLTAAVLAGLAVTAAPAQAVSHCKDSGAVYICEYGVTVQKLPDGTKQEFLVGTDSAVWTRWNNTSGKWTGWQSMGGVVSGRIVVIDRWSNGDPWKFALSVPTPDGGRWVNARNHEGVWTGWFPMPDPE
ncbi:hypothetical protein OG204_17075 [Streptomyces sp. NBC_01387]|uniref:hypothetical protein n=1 Tax=unclassified Streptomyces TaxID=2593676 RepID=UPI002023DC04|nr:MULTISPECIES: hypothetical protein [unclassified Streptomyces]MCX4549925.1 hypothetical protein [Streptomyces sp. NBC_01500]WSC21442.1 hypothetical protein OIE60_18115 [Streptomyces sp. NBC_01766]WSV55379.1 hypothetical protein OG282_17680 [Streptomyces sp. NBC_01014]